MQVEEAIFDHVPKEHIKHLSTVSCKDADVPGSVKYVPATHSVQIIETDASLHWPLGHTVQSAFPAAVDVPPEHNRHFPIPSCKDADVPGSFKYVPAMQFVQDEDAVFDHVPAEHIKHFSTVSCKDADVPGSVKCVPATQSVQFEAAMLDHVPEEHIEQAVPEKPFSL